MQTTSHLLMIRPVKFGFNPQTAVNNAFQVNTESDQLEGLSLKEFDNFVDILRLNDLDVTVVQDSADPHTPDSVFPNNWISFHSNGNQFLYPMFAANRRAERKPAVLEAIDKKFNVGKTIDLSGYEKQDLFLEGTGSMVLDRDFSIAYACLSPRTNETVLKDFCSSLNYKPVLFNATDGNGQDIYHTNVMMCVAIDYVVICLESITNPEEQQKVTDAINGTGKKIISISLKQMDEFAGNMLQVQNNIGEPLLVMSTRAYQALDQEQVKTLLHYNQIIHAPLDLIEKNGGGSARCMIAEVHLQPR